MSEGIKVLAENRRARHDYFVEDSLECGLSLLGTEVKSMKAAHFSFQDAWVELNHGELWLRNVTINLYKQAAEENHDPERKKRLLAHKEEIRKLQRKVEEKGFTLVPLKFYLKKGLIKVEVGVVKGKKEFDKREAIKERDWKRERDRELKR